MGKRDAGFEVGDESHNRVERRVVIAARRINTYPRGFDAAVERNAFDLGSAEIDADAQGVTSYFRGTGLPVTWIQSMREPPPDP